VLGRLISQSSPIRDLTYFAWLKVKLDGFFDIPSCFFLGMACRRAAGQLGTNRRERLRFCIVFEDNAKLHCFSMAGFTSAPRRSFVSTT
jgi:hypothetical protein